MRLARAPEAEAGRPEGRPLPERLHFDHAARPAVTRTLQRLLRPAGCSVRRPGARPSQDRTQETGRPHNSGGTVLLRSAWRSAWRQARRPLSRRRSPSHRKSHQASERLCLSSRLSGAMSDSVAVAAQPFRVKLQADRPTATARASHKHVVNSA
eukprot:scaffold22070_cov70-Phaeocystis_antarctica.AAC.1